EVGAEMGLIEPSVLCTEVGQGAVPSAVEGADGVDDPSPGQDLLHTDTAVSVEHPLQCALPDPRALRQEPQTDDLGVGENVEHMLQATVSLRHLRSTREQPPLVRLILTGEVEQSVGTSAMRQLGPTLPGLVQAGLHRRRG